MEDSKKQLFYKVANKVYSNLSVAELYEHTVLKKLGVISKDGALIVDTKPYTGRSPKDKFIVFNDYTRDLVWWGEANNPISQEVFNNLLNKALNYIQDNKVDLYEMDLYVGANPYYTLKVKLLTEIPYHAIFAHNIFIRLHEMNPYRLVNEIFILHLPNLKLDGNRDGVRSEVAIILDLYPNPFIFIAGTKYSGEIKKAVFTFLNYYYLKEFDILPMHCGANRSLKNMDSALFFGLSGTGKTTLSTDPNRRLIGDDEHGWAENDIFNFEGGSYAKVIKLDKNKEKEIYKATNKFGTVIENVVYNEKREIAFNDASITENTRSAYPNKYIEIMEQSLMGEKPTVIFFLTADATASLPLIALLDDNQIIEYFILGYTSKLAGTERGVKDPEPTFSECFAKPFLPLNPISYAKKLYQNVKKYNSKVWLVNTGWIGNPYPKGNRIDLIYTRKMVNAAINNEIDINNVYIHPVFNIKVPKFIKDLPENLFFIHNTWENQEQYLDNANKLKKLFDEKLSKYKSILI